MKQSFLKGTMLLFAAGILNRLLGFIPRLVLPRIIGAEGVGLFQLSYPFLILLLTMISGGLPVAIAKIVAEEEQSNSGNSRRILRVSLQLVFLLATVCAFICVFSAQWMSLHLFRDGRVETAFLVTIPMLYIVGVASVLRGYFQGKQNMLPTAVSQTIETVVRLVAVISFAWLCLPYGLAWAAAGAMAGVVTGEAAGLLYLIMYTLHGRGRGHNRQSPPAKSSSRSSGALKRLLTQATPITANKLVASGAYFLESVLIIQSLALAGVSSQQSTALYGILQGMIIPILVLPNALTYSLSLSLLPVISEAHVRHDWQLIGTRIGQSLKICIVTGIPFAVIAFVFAEPICGLLYNDREIAYMLQWMAPVALFLYVQGPLQAALQALDRSGVALRNTLVSAAVKLLLIYLLASMPQLGMTGALIAINVNIVLTALLHWLSARKYSHLNTRRLQIPSFLLCMLLMFTLALTAERITLNMTGPLHAWLAPLLAVACYVCFLFAFRIITFRQVRMLMKI